jgi:hypothetical protein
LTANDTIFFPSADFITLNIFLKRWSDLEPALRPRAVVRFINVFENVDVPLFYPKKRLFQKLSKYQKRNPSNLILAVETHNYGKYLESFGLETILLYYPTSYLDPILPEPQTDIDKLTVVTLGSARPDKGFEKLAEIIPRCQSLDTRPNLSFVVQGPAKHWGFGSERAERILMRTRDVKILPGKLADQEIQSALSRASIQLLPYFRDVYEMRGSAMLFDGCDAGVPLVAPAGTGFSFEVNKYKLGLTFSDFDNIPGLLTKLTPDDLEGFRKNITVFNRVRDDTMVEIFG